MNTRSMHRLVGAAAGLLVLAGCGGGRGGDVADKTGGETTVLRLATIDHVNNNGQSYGPQAFVDALGEVSAGQLKVEVTESYGEGAADAESRMVSAIASGDLDGGWPSTRAFANAGIAGLEAVEAPMTITSYAAEKALVSGPTAEKLLDQLDGSGVVGLGLAVGPLRRPFAAEAPLLGPQDWKDVPFRAYNSPVQADTVRALGGEPVNVGFTWIDEMRAGNLGAVEFDVAQYAQAGFTTEAANVTSNVVLWPKVFVLSMSQKRFDALTDRQRGWVQEAAEQAVQASVDATYDETTLARQLCDEGVRFIPAGADQIAGLRTAVAPVVAQLAADPTTAPLLAEIQALAAAHGEADVPDVPADCQQASAPDGSATIPEETSALPDGVYRAEITAAEVAQAGISNGPGWTGTWTLKVREGTYEVTCRPIDDPGHDCGNTSFDGPVDAGYLKGTGSTVYFVYDAELMSKLTGCKLPVSTEPYHCYPGGSYTLTWALDGDNLRFSDAGGVELYDKLLEPYQKIG